MVVFHSYASLPEGIFKLYIEYHGIDSVCFWMNHDESQSLGCAHRFWSWYSILSTTMYMYLQSTASVILCGLSKAQERGPTRGINGCNAMMVSVLSKQELHGSGSCQKIPLDKDPIRAFLHKPDISHSSRDDSPYLSIHPSIHLSIYLSVYLSVWLSIHLSIVF